MAGRPATVGQFVEQVQQAERDGFATAHVANIFGFDALTAAAVAGRETEKIELMTSVVPTFSRHPVYMAQQALSTNAACGGRFALGIGLSHIVVIEQVLGLSFAKPFTHMREYVAVLEPLLRQEPVSFEGEQYRVNAQLSVAGATRPSLLLAALAPRMLKLCGSQTDGTITWMTGPKTLRDFTIPRINEAAAAGGRPAPRVVAGLPIAVCDDPAAGRERARRAFAIYNTLPSYRAMLEREGAAEAADIVIVGDEDSVGEQLDQLAEIGVTDFIAPIFPVGSDREKSIARTRELLIKRARGGGRGE
jgi:F420-dependent oxidoreductase-like protein